MLRLAPALLLIALAGCTASRLTDGPPWPTPRADANLQASVETLAADIDGVLGVYARHLPTGREVMVRADEAFPTASMIKIPILVAVFEQIEAGDLRLGQRLTFRDSLRYIEDEGELFSQLQDSSTVFVHTAVEQMLSASDNTASLWLQRLVTGESINEWLAGEGFETTRMNSRTEGRRPDWERYGWGQTTPREMADLVRRIVEGEAVSPAADLEMHRLLTRTHWDDEAISQLPPSVQTASKQGVVSQSRSEVVYVHAPSGPYVFCVITREQEDTRWEPDNEGYRAIRAVSRLLWETFEPDSDWRPLPDAEQFRF